MSDTITIDEHNPTVLHVPVEYIYNSANASALKSSSRILTGFKVDPSKLPMRLRGTAAELPITYLVTEGSARGDRLSELSYLTKVTVTLPISTVKCYTVITPSGTIAHIPEYCMIYSSFSLTLAPPVTSTIGTTLSLHNCTLLSSTTPLYDKGALSVEKHTFARHLKTQIYTRYYFAPLLTIPSYHSRVKQVIDTNIPFLIFRDTHQNEFALANNLRYTKDLYSMSPLLSALTGAPLVPFKYLLSAIAPTDLDIHALLHEVKAKELSVIFTGVGGTGMNTLVWLSKLCELYHVTQLFKEIHIFEKDSVDFSNIFRFPIKLSQLEDTLFAEPKKAFLALPYAQQLATAVFTHDTFIETLDDVPSLFLTEDSKLKPNFVTYGAPFVANRNFLSSLGQFISATHANNTASLYINPIADDSLQFETYGLIQLNSFFINQILMAIEFLNILQADLQFSSDTHFKDITTDTSVYISNEAVGEVIEVAIDSTLTAREID